MIKSKLLNTLLLLLLQTSCQPISPPETKIEIGERVLDNAQILTPSQEEKLFKLIQDIEQNIGSQIAIITIDTLEGEKIEQFSLRKMKDLDLGREEFKDGLLMTVSVKDRKIRIEVGYGLEKIIKDEIAAQILREQMSPRFKEEKFFDGFLEALKKTKRLIEENKHLVGSLP